LESSVARWVDDPVFTSINDALNKKAGMSNDINSPFYARLYVLRQIAVQQQKLHANFAECGVYAGMSMYFVHDLCDKRFIGIDSFEGVSEPGEFDTDYFKTVKLDIPIDRANLILEGCSSTELYAGWIPEVFEKIDTLQYSYVHIDVDLYQPTKDSVEYFWPKIVPGGVIICDDYGSYKTIGARKAMDDFFGKENILELPTGQGIIWK
jgi:hypothetical protein